MTLNLVHIEFDGYIQSSRTLMVVRSWDWMRLLSKNMKSCVLKCENFPKYTQDLPYILKFSSSQMKLKLINTNQPTNKNTDQTNETHLQDFCWMDRDSKYICYHSFSFVIDNVLQTMVTTYWILIKSIEQVAINVLVKFSKIENIRLIAHRRINTVFKNTFISVFKYVLYKYMHSVYMHVLFFQ